MSRDQSLDRIALAEWQDAGRPAEIDALVSRIARDRLNPDPDVRDAVCVAEDNLRRLHRQAHRSLVAATLAMSADAQAHGETLAERDARVRREMESGR